MELALFVSFVSTVLCLIQHRVGAIVIRAKLVRRGDDDWDTTSRACISLALIGLVGSAALVVAPSIVFLDAKERVLIAVCLGVCPVLHVLYSALSPFASFFRELKDASDALAVSKSRPASSKGLVITIFAGSALLSGVIFWYASNSLWQPEDRAWCATSVYPYAGFMACLCTVMVSFFFLRVVRFKDRIASMLVIIIGAIQTWVFCLAMFVGVFLMWKETGICFIIDRQPEASGIQSSSNKLAAGVE